MSKDQLGWDDLLKSAQEDEKDAPAKPAVEAILAPIATEPEPKKKSARAKTEKKAAAKTETPSAPQEYAKKNWAKLEMKPATSIKAEPKTELKVDAKPETKPEAKLAATKTVAIPVVREASEVPYDHAHEQSSPTALSEPDVISVSELNKYIRELLEGEFSLVWLKGEISNFKAHTSGHFYFSLKDSRAQISAVMFRGYNSQLRFRPEDGMEVLVRGKVTVYEPRGNYQIFCEVMEPVGAGALQKAFEQLKAKLQKEGLFDAARKRPLPALPRHIAIVTSPTGAAIRDMLNVLGRRFKGAQITLIPCKVQGDQAPKEIINAIEMANRLKDVDVMIIGRGGGSIEDLWAFNEEKVARAIAASRIPTISAVGHEIDFTIADFVADLRAPTPSAAAELVVKNAADLNERIARMLRSIRSCMGQRLVTARDRVSQTSKRLVDPQRKLQDAALRCDELLQRLQLAIFRELDQKDDVAGLEQRLQTATRNVHIRKREALQKNMAVLDSLSPLKVLDRGFSMVVSSKGEIVTDAAALKAGDDVTVRMCKGSIEAKVTKVEKKR
ncbi:MAG: exodeoxyribonuclease VII large subunit [Bdellovibrionota bacterium]